MAWALTKIEPEPQDARLDAVAKDARADAVAGLPPSDAVSPGETERRLIDAAARARAGFASRAQEIARSFAARAPSAPDVTTPALDAHLALRQTQGRVAHEFAEAKARAKAADDDLKLFRNTHELHRAARYPASALLQAGLLFAACVFEAAFSAALFATEDDRGLLGGAVTAVGLSGANVTLGFLAGFLGLRYLQHRATAPRVAGGIGFGLIAALGVFLNIYAALWRDRMAEPEVASFGAADGWFDQLLHISQPQAIVLLMLGGGVWAFAALKGYSGFDDPYPDYGKMQRAAEEAREDFAELRDEARDDLEAPVNVARAEISSRLDVQSEALRKLERAYDETIATLAALNAQALVGEEACVRAVALYRQENRAARADTPPRYFDDPLTLAAMPDALSACGDVVTSAKTAFDAARRESNETLRTLLTDLEAAQAKLDEGA